MFNLIKHQWYDKKISQAHLFLLELNIILQQSSRKQENLFYINFMKNELSLVNKIIVII